jgi:RES domain-containing protein
MPFLWRISNYATLSGEGGLLYSARWHTSGQRIVYLAESPAGAMIEALVHLELDDADWPRSYRLMQAEHPADLRVETLKPSPVKSWKTSFAATRRLGNEWLQSQQSALARVPSAILAETWNVLLNPDHPDARRVRILRTIRAEYDPRLLVSIPEKKE